MGEKIEVEKVLMELLSLDNYAHKTKNVDVTGNQGECPEQRQILSTPEGGLSEGQQKINMDSGSILVTLPKFDLGLAFHSLGGVDIINNMTDWHGCNTV